MTDPEILALAGRMKEARLRAAVLQKEEVTKEGMVALLSAVLGRTLHPTQWRRYESGESEPSLEVIRATARVSGLSEAYIAFGAAVSGDDAMAIAANALLQSSGKTALAKALQSTAKGPRSAKLERADVPAPKPAVGKDEEKKGA